MPGTQTDPLVDTQPAEPPPDHAQQTVRQPTSWRIAEQYFHYGDIELSAKSYDDGFVLKLQMGPKVLRVFFDPAGRIIRYAQHAEPGGFL